MKKKNMTYAEAADKITKKIGELEKMAKSSDRFAKETAARMLPRYQEKLDSLYNEQERMKGEAFQKDMNKLKMKYGGELPKYFDGGALMNAGMGIMQGFGQGQASAEAEGDSMAGMKGAADAGIAAALGPYGMLYTMGKGLADAGQDMLSDGTYTDYSGETYNTYSSDGARHAAAWMKPQHEYMLDALKKDEHGRRDWKTAGLSLIPGVNQVRAGMGNINFAYGGKLPKMANGGEPPTYWDWIETRPDLRNDPGSHGIYQTWLEQVYPKTGFDPSNVYHGNTGIQQDEYGRDYVQPVTPPMDTQYAQSQSAINPKTTVGNDAYKPVGSGMYNDFASTGTPNPDGSFTKEGSPIGGEKIFGAPTPTPDSPMTQPTAGGGMGWQDILYKGAMYAPTIYNFARGLQKPQTLDHKEFQNPYEQKILDIMANREYNIDPQLQSNRSTLNNLKRSLAQGAGGSSAAYLSNLGKLQLNTDKMNEAAYAQKQNMDNQYRAQEAGMMGDLGARWAQTKFNIQDVNDRNKAARDAHMGKAMEGVSGIAQTEKKMSNLSARDQERLAVLQAMYPDYGYTTDDRGYVTGFNYKG